MSYRAKRSISKLQNSNRDISRSRTQYDKETSVIASEQRNAWQSIIYALQ
ncbi:hypothetical protein [Helicobacter sp. T3_23-1056]